MCRFKDQEVRFWSDLCCLGFRAKVWSSKRRVLYCSKVQASCRGLGISLESMT